jgi:hypothetical protein
VRNPSFHAHIKYLPESLSLSVIDSPAWQTQPDCPEEEVMKSIG